MKAKKQSLQNYIKAVLHRHLNVQTDRAFIFGSFAQKNQKAHDIDIGIESSRKIPPRLLIAIEEELENSDIPYTVDVVDFSFVSDQFKVVAKQHILPL